MVHAEHVIFVAVSLGDTRMIRGGLFGMQQRNPGERPLVAQVAFVREVPLIDALHHRQPPAVVQHAGKFRHPRTHAVGRALGHPDPNFRLALHRILPAIGLFEANAEDSADRAATHDGAILLGAPAVRPRRHEPAPCLVVGELNRRELAGGLHVRRSVRDEARLAD